MAEAPEVPLTIEGAYALHQMFRFRRADWKKLPNELRARAVDEASVLLQSMEKAKEPHPSQSAIYSLLGHKGDFLLVHFRDSVDELHEAELAIGRLQIADYLEPTYSYLSVTELGLYESTSKTYSQLLDQGIEPHSQQWNQEIAEVTKRQSAAMATRLYPEIPPARYLCFYPMDRKRAENKNWYSVPFKERQRMMHDHGMIGRRYADSVRQVITGSIGMDDWEWGVDLFSDDPLVFKKLIYEMRFDEVSAIYALFGTFYVGIRTLGGDLAASALLS